MDYSGDAIIKVRLFSGSLSWLRSANSDNNVKNVKIDGDWNNKYPNKTNGGVRPDLPLKNK